MFHRFNCKQKSIERDIPVSCYHQIQYTITMSYRKHKLCHCVVACCCHVVNNEIELTPFPDGFTFHVAPIFDSNYYLMHVIDYTKVYTVKCHYNACHYNANASLTRSILGSQTAPTSWHALMTVPEWLSTWAKVWNHRGLISHSGNDTSLFPYKWNKTNVSHLLVMSIQSIHDWSSIKHTDYSSPMLWECHHLANMAPGCWKQSR